METAPEDPGKLEDAVVAELGEENRLGGVLSLRDIGFDKWPYVLGKFGIVPVRQAVLDQAASGHD